MTHAHTNLYSVVTKVTVLFQAYLFLMLMEWDEHFQNYKCLFLSFMAMLHILVVLLIIRVEWMLSAIVILQNY